MEVTAIPLAFFAGLLSLLSPCVLPMIPAVTASSMQASKIGVIALALGISVAFALAGTVLTFALLSFGLSTELLRHFSVGLMLVMGTVLLIPALNQRLSYWLSLLVGRFGQTQITGSGSGAQFVIGASLGLVWLPCVGPTLGTAIALASTGDSLVMAFLVMLSFGIGTAIPLVLIGYFSGLKVNRLKGASSWGKNLLGVTLILLAVVILTDFDRHLEMLAIEILPDWITSI
ncbi:cytochrome c biogenesis CcdA family protein [Neiella marina]|uniref:Cytochrome c biogenesis CcdA family protein n=1 Tax=Neiella holothuriorum TaxID=2870530 RepID=A0ABS7EIE7_9GAMM|nr:cytochrome c biogenesis CcdA family protein [Neiella holothuriorum]MBW8192129.1 cytochrome c biogenesis CcdA family protein [Neiella holothuriorum]